MANSSVSELVGNCIAPFLDAAKFGQGGYVDGRFCAPVYELPGIPICCLPCPATSWAYSDKFARHGTIAQWFNVVGLVLIAFMLISYVVLPAQQTRCHYLSVCLISSIAMIALGFTIPLGAKPDQCYDLITPNDMYSSMECAWSGALVIAGGLSAVMWIFLRALSMNLQICWDIVPGKKFFYVSQLAGWGIPAVLFTVTITVTGVSFRFGSACQINHKDSMADFWGPLLAFAGAAGLLQLSTFGYCIHVYLKNFWSDQSATSTTVSSRELPSHSGTNSARGRTTRAVYRRLKKVLWLQWRGILIVTIILIDVIFFSIVYVYLDGMQNNIVTDATKWARIKPWLTCLISAQGDKDQCLHLVNGWLIGEPTLIAVLFMLSLAGVQAFLLLTRPSVFSAWWHLIRKRFNPRQEFVSLDAQPDVMRRTSKHELMNVQRNRMSTTFEMQPKGPYTRTNDLDLKGFDSRISSPDEAYRSPLHAGRDSPSVDEMTYDKGPSSSHQQFSRERLSPDYTGSLTPSSPPHESPTPAGFAYAGSHVTRQANDYFAQHRLATSPESRQYYAPHTSFSAPVAPSREGSIKSVSFDPRDPYTRGGLALNPPSEAAESREDVSTMPDVYRTDARR